MSIPERLFRLGFQGWRIRAGKSRYTDYIEPPVYQMTAGMFNMGSAEIDGQADFDEKPQHRIFVDAFNIGVFPVTVAEYANYLKDNPNVPVPPSYTFPPDAEWCVPEWRGKELRWQTQQAWPDHPVVRVDWRNARDYAAWLAKVTGQPWRLPTEAEWEKAARWDEATQHVRIYPWGDAWDNTRANTRDGGPGHTTPVGSYPGGASPCGAQDMAGNVWEWCSSLYMPYPYGPHTERETPGATDDRVLRGGSWDCDPQHVRAAVRDGLAPDMLDNGLGFRLALTSGVR